MKPTNYLEMARTKPKDEETIKDESDPQDEEDNPKDMPGQIALLSSIMKRMAHKHAKHMAKAPPASGSDVHPSIHFLMGAKPNPKS